LTRDWTNLSRAFVMAIVAAVATVIFAAGVAYALVRPSTYQSEATVVLTPTPADPADLPQVLDAFQRSGTVGTYVELLASEDTKKSAGDPPVSLKVSSVPDTRAIHVSAKSGDKNIVQPALRSVLAAAQRLQGKLEDVWTLRTLQEPTAPSQASTSPGLILIASFLLALLGGISTWTLLRRYGAGSDRGGPRRDRADAIAAAGWLTREGPRYPTSR
jgi:capsular polysaccharide biosynthesis protein